MGKIQTLIALLVRVMIGLMVIYLNGLKRNRSQSPARRNRTSGPLSPYGFEARTQGHSGSHRRACRVPLCIYIVEDLTAIALWANDSLDIED